MLGEEEMGSMGNWIKRYTKGKFRCSKRKLHADEPQKVIVGAKNRGNT